MGIEILKVSSKIVRDSKGQKANLLKYAYKFNSLLSFAEDAQVQFKTGCFIAERYVEVSQNFTGRVTDGEGRISFNWSRGTISDYRLAEEQYDAEKSDIK
tara:strand:- start:1201 stop:1500 length:300 start_codon:yes stop_codon:yes gene_type:complete